MTVRSPAIVKEPNTEAHHDQGRNLTILSRSGATSYRAIAGNQRTEGRTAGEALDALTKQLDEDTTLIIVQSQ